jgi:hypothetical protein
VLLDPECRSRGIVDPAAVEAALGDPSLETGRDAQKLWMLVSLELFLRSYF